MITRSSRKKKLTAMVNMHLLDRNIMIMIRNHVSGNGPKDERQKNLLEELRRLDFSWNTFSIILSITEGRKKSIQSVEDFISIVEDESKLLSAFFKYAQNDGNYWLSTVKEFRDNYSIIKEINLEKYIDFLKYVSPEICEPTKPTLKRKKMNRIMDAAFSRGIDCQHPIVWCCIAVLYGNTVAQSVIKPNKSGSTAYNAASDIMTISRIQQYRAIDSEENPSINFKFLTADEALSDLYNLIYIGKSILREDASEEKHITISTINIKREFFPDMPDKDYDFLLENISNRKLN